MEKLYLRISSITYIITAVGIMVIVFNPNFDVAPEIKSYMIWWRSQPNTIFEAFIVKIVMAALIVSFVGAIALLFLRKWGGYLFLLCSLIMIIIELLVPGYAPRPIMESSFDTISSISIGCILILMICSKKLELFERNNAVE